MAISAWHLRAICVIIRRVLHVTNGDIAAGRLRDTGVAGELLVIREALHVGPLPDVDDASFRTARAHFIAECGWASEGDALAEAEARDAALDAAQGEVVLWFESDLFDQLQVALVVDRLARRDPRPRVAVAATGPGWRPVAELTGSELAAAFEGRSALADDGFAQAQRAWAALRAGDQNEVRRTAAAGGPLPDLTAALERWLQEQPLGPDGLSRTQRTARRALEAGPLDLGELLAAVNAAEDAPFMSDAALLVVLEGHVERDGDRFALA